MAKEKMNPYAALERAFHEPNRMAIVSSLSGAENGKTFVELKDECQLTDGNLSRHLKTLSNAGIIDIKKTFVKSKPQTKAYLSKKGRDEFLQYLKALETVLKKAVKNAKTATGKMKIKPA